MQRVDYDRIAHLYDEPLRAHVLDARLVEFVAEHPEVADRLRALDVGCGTGTQQAANRAAFPAAPLVGVDLFGGMLARARARCPSVGWVQGDGSRLPLGAERFDYVTNQFSYHHVRDKPRFLREGFRVLAAGGRFVMTNIDPWAMPGWGIYRFFPEALELDCRDFLRAESFAELMRDAGFHDVTIAREHGSERKSVSEFLAYARQRHRASEFMAIPDGAYEAGVRRVERAVAEAGDREATFESEFCLLQIRGDRP